MNVTIDTSVVFTRPDGSAFLTVDAWEFNDFIQSLWNTKGKEKPDLHSDGTPKLDGDGKPVLRKSLEWELIQAEVSAWAKEHCQIDLKKSEVIAIWKAWPAAFEKKSSLLDDPVPEPTSPTSQPSTDPRSWE